MKRELQIAVNTGQAMGDFDALESSVISTVARCGTAAETQQIFRDWKTATGLLAKPLATDTRGRLKPEANGHHHPRLNGHDRENGDNGWLRML
jgi:hypothetical protein